MQTTGIKIISETYSHGHRCVTETYWLSARDTETISLLTGFKTFRRDGDSSGGGIMAFINLSLLPTHLAHIDPENNGTENNNSPKA